MATAAVLAGTLLPPAAAAAGPSSGILPGSRVTVVGPGPVTATAAHGSTLYLGGAIPAVGLRTGGLAATNATSGALDRAVPELEGRGDAAPQAPRVVADGRDGVYLLGTAPTNAIDGVPFGASWGRLDEDGTLDRGLPQRFTTAAGTTATVFQLSVGRDGTTYLAGDFTAVDGMARAGLAAIAADGRLLPWSPEASGGAVQRLQPTAEGVVLAGTFTRVGAGAGQARSGLALVDAAVGAPQEWAPATTGTESRALTGADASAGIVADGDTAYLASPTGVFAVGLSGAGTARDLALRPTPSTAITTIAAGASGRLYVGGSFSAIGAQAAQPARPGVAEIVGATGQATDWAPAAPPQSGRTLAVSGDAVYVGGFTSASCDGTRAYRRSDATRTAWDPRLVSAGSTGCAAVQSLAVSGERVWAGGGFDAANKADRSGYAAIDVANDQVLPWAPKSGGFQVEVQDLEVSPDGQTIYVASDGTSLNGRPRAGLAAVAATGAADTAAAVRDWDPAPNGPVHDIVPAADGDSVYLGGRFSAVGGQSRANLAAVQSSGTGAATSWAPDPDGQVNALELAADGTLYVGGSFEQIGATPAGRNDLAAFAAGSGNPSAWDPALDRSSGYEPYTVLDLALGDDRVYVAGYFDGQIGGRQRRGVAALNRTDGAATDWDADLDQWGVRTVSTTANGDVYLMGIEVGSSFQTVGGASRPSGLAAVTANGAVTGWNPGVASDGQTSYYPSFNFARPSSNEIVEVAGRVVVPMNESNGAFDGVRQSGFLAFAAGTAPSATSPAVPPAVTGRPLVDQRLTCAPGAYDGSRPLARSYQWRRDGTPIDGQTGSTYTTRAADVDQRLSCRERVENAAGHLETVSAEITILAGVPANDAPPTVTGTAKVGDTVTCDTGLWSNGVDEYVYAWLRDGAVIDGAAGATYALVAADGDRRVACEVTATNAAGTSAPARSGAVTVTVPGNPPGENPPGENPPGDHPPVENPPVDNPPIWTPPSFDPPPGAAKPKLTLTKATALRGRKLRLTLRPPAAGRISVRATVKSGKRTVTVARASGSAKKASTARLTLEPTRTGKRALKPGRTHRMTFSVTFTSRDGGKVTSTKAFRVKVKR